jgi:hypothetical protein
MMSQFLDPGSIATGGVTPVVNGVEQRNIGVSASAIQQVKINHNPYAADFSRPGRGRIEILTKPASQEYHGTLNVLFRDQVFNARDAFALTRPATQRRIFEGSLLGPLGGSKRNSFLISVDRRETDSEEVVFAETLAGPTAKMSPIRDAPRRFRPASRISSATPISAPGAPAIFTIRKGTTVWAARCYPKPE